MKSFLIFLTLFGVALHPKLADHLKPAKGKGDQHVMEGVDFIYMINLDQRPEKFDLSSKQLADWGIYPYRFSAVNGWELTLEEVNDLGVVYKPWMKVSPLTVTYYDQSNWPKANYEITHKVGRTYFGHRLSLGAIGICLSHISILQDAWDSGYNTIWVMEDDIHVLKNPHEISTIIHELDAIVGKNEWDILFTDQDTKAVTGVHVRCVSYGWRSNFEPQNISRFELNVPISSRIKKIGARYGSYSMIIRRSGIRKLLKFFKKYQLFLAYDMEYTLPNDIKLFGTIEDIVSTIPNAPSDNSRPDYKRKT